MRTKKIMKKFIDVRFMYLWSAVVMFNAIGLAQTMAKQDSVILNAGECNIYGTLTVPQTTEKIPVALIIAGSGPTDRNGNNPMMTNNSYKMLSDSLSRHGIATLRYDKRLIAQSVCQQTEEQLRFDDYVKDARGWIEYLANKEQFSEIVVIGHSEGSLIGLVAGEDNPKVSKFISLAGVGVSADVILKEQLTKQLIGLPDSLRSQIFSYIDQLKEGNLLEGVPPTLYSLFRPSVQPYMISWFKYNPQAEIATLKIPTMILQGDMDIQVSEKEAELLHQANPKSQKFIIKGMNHVLKNSQSTNINEQGSDSYNNPNTPINKELVERIVEFIKLAN
ncbi:MAG: lysophospholipase [Bacteroidales bacterium]|jgi:pimeloyl-ACP methyl ester carboxylesterase|nr:lysophospholipase [Bacteroidales bacterium]